MERVRLKTVKKKIVLKFTLQVKPSRVYDLFHFPRASLAPPIGMTSHIKLDEESVNVTI